MSDDNQYEVYAVRYAARDNRTRGESFIFDDDHQSAHPMDYSVWVIRNKARTILVNTGYDGAEATARDRPILIDSADALADIDIRSDDLYSIIITHLHYDHAGGLGRFPQAHLHMQAAEMAYATGPCMCHGALRDPFTAEHVCETVRRLYAG